MAIDDIAENEIRAALDGVLTAQSTRISERGARFLRYVVEMSLAGRAAQLKAYTIAVDIFGRGVDFDPAKDAVVRNEAARLRSGLALYYAVEGALESVIIHLPVGGYVPRFERRVPASPAASPSENVLLVRAGLQPRSTVFRVPREAGWGFERRLPVIVVRPLGQGAVAPYEASFAMSRSVVTALISYHSLRIARLEAGQSLQDLVAALRPGNEPGSVYVLDIAAGVEERTLRCQWSLSDYRSGLVLASQEELESAASSAMMVAEKTIAESIAMAIGQRWGIVNLNERKLHPDQYQDAYSCVVHAATYSATLDDDQQRDLKLCLEAAVKEEPHYSDAWAMLSYIRMNELRGLYADPSEGSCILKDALGMADEAVRLMPNSALAHSMRSTVLFAMGNFEEFEKAARQAIALNPGAGEHYLMLGNRLYVMGRYEEGVEFVQHAIAREQYHPTVLYGVPILELYRRRDYAGALRLSSNHSIDDRYYFMHVMLAAVCGQLGATDRAARHIRILLRLRPNYANEFYLDWRGRKFREDYIAHIVEGLDKAGFTVVEPLAEMSASEGSRSSRRQCAS